ncbi:ficolin-1 [Plakobranchus ocellatus]|uniref:Ficolin-1 n=1 Tax=Plakobranchus ocellatus TaxID=259542 RepID=A0AAV3YR29_9GAST|nr:ficolin-1 [Plakobranchus ocellatus]
MRPTLITLLVLCILFGIKGLELTLDLNGPSSDGRRETCGILTCNANLTQSEETISGMNIFKKVQNGSNNSEKNKQNILVASLTLQQPFLTRVSDGVNVDGRLEAGQASIRMELTKQKDCEAKYTCEAKKLDNQRKESISSCQVLQRQVQDSNQEHDEPEATSEGSLPVLILLQQLDTKLTLLDSEVGSVENRLEDKISSLHEVIENTMESHTANKVCEVDNKQSSIDSLINKISKLKNHFDKSLETLTIKFESSQREFLANTAISNDVFNSTSTTISITHDLLTELLALEQTDQLDLKHLRDTVHQIHNSSRDLTKDINKSLSQLETEFKTDLVQFQSDMNNITTGILNSIDNKFSETNRNLTNNLNLIHEQFSPQMCSKGMRPVLSQGSFPYHPIFPTAESNLSFIYLCDTITDGGGWIIIQRRTTGNVDFYLDWATYRKGFGSLDDDFWLGNDNIHTITSSGTYELRVDLKYQGRSAFAHYSKFSIDGEDNNYTLRLGDYDGTAGDSLAHHRNRFFSTFDKDNDYHSSNCAAVFSGAWWYGGCHNSNLNGKWLASSNKGPTWASFSASDPVYYSEMKIRKV